MNDPTESIRRIMVSAINDIPGNRKQLEEEHGKIYDTKEVSAEFEITGFAAPFVIVRRWSDNKRGTMVFQDQPRYYFNFKEKLV